MGKNLFQKVWEKHVAGTLASGQSQLFIDLHLLHEVTSPQAFIIVDKHIVFCMAFISLF